MNLCPYFIQQREKRKGLALQFSEDRTDHGDGQPSHKGSNDIQENVVDVKYPLSPFILWEFDNEAGAGTDQEHDEEIPRFLQKKRQQEAERRKQQDISDHVVKHQRKASAIEHQLNALKQMKVGWTPICVIIVGEQREMHQNGGVNPQE